MMNTNGFNLVDDDWIPLGDRHVSIRKALTSAHSMPGWPAGEPPVAEGVLRLLVAMTYRITGMDSDIRSREEFAVEQRNLLDRGQFDLESVNRYLDRYRDLFWLTEPQPGSDPFAQDHSLQSVPPHPIDKAVTAWSTGNNPALGPHTAHSTLQFPIAAQQLLAQRCYSAGGRCTHHPLFKGTKKAAGAFEGAPLRDTNSVHPIGEIMYDTLVYHLIPAPDDFKYGSPFWETPCSVINGPYSEPASLLEQISVRQHKSMLYHTGPNGQINGFTIAKGRGYDPDLACPDPYVCADSGGTKTKPRKGRSFWRDVEALLRYSVAGDTDGSNAPILEWANGTGSGSYMSDGVSWCVVTHRGDQSKNLEWALSHTPDLMHAMKNPYDCIDFMGAAAAAEAQLIKKTFATWHDLGMSPDRQNLGADLSATFWGPVESGFWRTARQSPPSPDELDGLLRESALTAFDIATAGLGRSLRVLSAVERNRSRLRASV